MHIIEKPEDMRALSGSWKKAGYRVSLVPTMGFFHEGHLALMDMACRLARRVVVSLFVNPAQFGPGEDLDAYPRDLERDIRLAKKRGAHCIFAPASADIYADDHQTWIEVTEISRGLCGESRPGHFRGVATVVSKLFNMVQPDIAVFGEKDFQQLQVIRTMVRDLNFPVEIHSHPIVREHDGLAMSSRNSYLSRKERKSAACLNQAIDMARRLKREGYRDRMEITGRLQTFIETFPATAVDYIFFGDPETLTESDMIPSPALLALAVYVGKTRLIDNSVI